MPAVAVVVVALLILLPVLLALIGVRHRAMHPSVQAAPRELVRRALVIIPSHPDGRGVEQAVDRVLQTDPRVDVVVVDSAAAGAQVAGPARPRVTVLRQPAPCGPAEALRLGAARGLQQHYDAVIELSVAHSRLARRITSLLEALDDGAHVAIGSRYIPGGRVLECGVVRRLVSRGVNAAVRWYTRLPLRDVTAHICAYRRAAIEQGVLEATGHGHDFGIDVLLRCRDAGLRLSEVPVTAAGAMGATGLAVGRDVLARAFGWRRAAPVDHVARVIDITDPAATPAIH